MRFIYENLTYKQIKMNKILKNTTTIQFSGGCFMIALANSPDNLSKKSYGKLN